MNKDLSACNGKIKGGSNNCPQKLGCKRFEVHLQNNEMQSYIEVPYLAVVNKSCTFKL